MKISSLLSAAFVSWELLLVLYLMISLLSFLYYKSRVVNNQLDDSYKKKRGELVAGLIVYECGYLINAGVSFRVSNPPF